MPKIMNAEIVQSPKFYLDELGNYFPEATTFILTGNHLKYLCNLFHSNTITYIFKTFYAGGGLGENGFRYKKAYFENLPIPTYANTELHHKIKYAKDKDCIEKFVYELYGFSQREIYLIENS